MHNARLTSFQKRVFDALFRIPAGRVTTYKALAESIGCGSAQAVGQALKRNPFAPDVPCHRVISSDLRLGGYQGKTAGDPVRRKIQLLAKEGVHFRGGRISDPGQVLNRLSD
ncbi:MAG: MGMT family protein [Verrucomicrobia bacterium]|nr:MGMT family protein [Verrucomicrobiota bacterium]